jgi:serine/threonine-protein kinase
MALTAGQRIGPYEIVGALGAGGMGEVYRARDARLDRDIAIKILPELFAQDPERLARFEREAKALAALNHPNIAAIYGIEVTEHIARGAVPLAEALPIARGERG